jgi:hypothetical protein
MALYIRKIRLSQEQIEFVDTGTGSIPSYGTRTLTTRCGDWETEVLDDYRKPTATEMALYDRIIYDQKASR